MFDESGGKRSEDQLGKALSEALDRLESLAAKEQTEMPDFQLLITKGRRRGLWLDLLRFWLIALAAVTAGLFSLRLYPAFYLTLQVVLAGGFLFAALAYGRRTNGWVKR